MGLRPGDAVDVRFTKWGGGRHWEYSATVLGDDDLGIWCGSPLGTRLERPAASFTSAFPWVTLFPRDQPWAASYYDSVDPSISIYVDLTTVPVWDGRVVTDLDLDLIPGQDGSLVLDDDDDFDKNRVTLGYPADVARRIRRLSRRISDHHSRPHEHVGK